MKTLFANIRKTFFAGLLFWVPLVITIFVVNFVLQLTIHLLGLIPTQYLSVYIETPLPGFNFIFIILLILLTGWLVNQYIGRMDRYWETLLKRIPLFDLFIMLPNSPLTPCLHQVAKHSVMLFW